MILRREHVRVKRRVCSDETLARRRVQVNKRCTGSGRKGRRWERMLRQQKLESSVGSNQISVDDNPRLVQKLCQSYPQEISNSSHCLFISRFQCYILLLCSQNTNYVVHSVGICMHISIPSCLAKTHHLWQTCALLSEYCIFCSIRSIAYTYCTHLQVQFCSIMLSSAKSDCWCGCMCLCNFIHG